MKKLSTLLLVLVLTVVLTGCGAKEDVITTKTCTAQYDGYEATYKLTATNDEIDKIKMDIVLDNKTLGVETLATLTDEQKEQIKTNMLSTFGLDSSTNEGLEVIVDIQDQMTVTIDADLKIAEPDVLKNVGLDFSDADMSLEKTVKYFEKDGATCE